MMGRWGGPWMHGGFGLEGLIAMALHLLFWIVIIVLAIKFFKKYLPQIHLKEGSKDQAIEILRQRYAKGEIDTEEFNLRKKELEG